MNQRTANVTVLGFFREHPAGVQAVAESKPLAKALKVLEKRAETLRANTERRFAEVPTDLADEPLVMAKEAIYADLKGEVCLPCSNKKAPRASFCTRCYEKVDAGVRKALWKIDIYPQAFSRAVKQLMRGDAHADG